MALEMKLNKEEYLNKMHGCWIGKNIGGTLGDAYEGTHDILDIKGFSTAKGEAAPNDEKYFTDGVHPDKNSLEEM